MPHVGIEDVRKTQVLFNDSQKEMASFKHRRLVFNFEIVSLFDINYIKYYSEKVSVSQNFLEKRYQDYAQVEPDSYNLLSKGKGHSMEGRIITYFELKKHKHYSDLEVRIHHTYLYFYSKSMNLVIFTTGMQLDDYIEIMESNGANKFAQLYFCLLYTSPSPRD